MGESEKQIKAKVWVVLIDEIQYLRLSKAGSFLVQGGTTFMVPPKPPNVNKIQALGASLINHPVLTVSMVGRPELTASLVGKQLGSPTHKTILALPDDNGNLPAELENNFYSAHAIEFVVK